MLSNALERIHELFNNKTIRSVLSKLRYLVFLVVFIIFVPHIRPSWFWPGFIVTIFGEVIQVWCFASLEKNRVLADKGLYMLTRNPMYLGRFFVLLGFLLLTGNIWIILVFAVLYYFYMVNLYLVGPGNSILHLCSQYKLGRIIWWYAKPDCPRKS